MRYRTLRECVDDLERHGHLTRVRAPVNPYLEIAEIQRRVYRAGGPAILFENVEGTKFPVLGNLFGTLERGRFLFRHTLEQVHKAVQLKADPTQFWQAPLSFLKLPWTAWSALPRHVSNARVLQNETTLSRLPQIQSWPQDGGAFITLPQVLTESPDRPGILNSNVGMYRIQLSGNRYTPDREAGMHYQIHRGIGVHHAQALRQGQPLRVSIFIGGPPAHTLAAVMPLPEGLSELVFAGMLGGRRFRYTRRHGFPISADADFCITGTVQPGRTLPEGPFGDHLGYYSLQHEFPVLEIEHVSHRPDAIWPFTVVGRPPQEDTTFGKLIHELTAPMVPKEIPGLRALHAVDASGVHPLLLAIGSERYAPFQERVPQEILTIAHAILGFGQCSLAKYLLITAHEDNPDLNVQNIGDFFAHILERADWTRDLHFLTRTTIDTLDYSGTELNAGSKVIIATAGPPRRTLEATAAPAIAWPEGFGKPHVALPGILVLEAPPYSDPTTAHRQVDRFAEAVTDEPALTRLPLVVLVDDADFCARHLNNLLWVTFTRSNPSHDISGIRPFIENKHWGCEGSLIIDARIKPHHAPPLEEDPATSRKVDQLATPGGPLHGII